MSQKTKWQFEKVRIGRRNGWARVAIVSETNGRCYVAMREMKAFGSLAQARKYIADTYAAEERGAPT